MTGVSALPVDLLAQRCSEETANYKRRQPSDPRFCFELLRLALAEGLPQALTWMFRIYEPQVQSWVYAHNRFVQTDQSADIFASEALQTFYFAVRGPKFDRFPSLMHLLSYLKACVHTTIAQYLRDQKPGSTLPLESVPESGAFVDLGAQVGAADLWAHICRLLPDERDRLLARCAFVLDLRPREIVEAYPDRWQTEREISVALYRIRRVLRQDDELRRWSGQE